MRDRGNVNLALMALEEGWTRVTYNFLHTLTAEQRPDEEGGTQPALV